MNQRHFNTKKGITLSDLIALVVTLCLLAAILFPLISNILENTYQEIDNSNARLIYNLATMWYSENLTAKENLTSDDMQGGFRHTKFPTAQSKAFGGNFTVSVTNRGVVNVKTTTSATFDPITGQLH